MQSWSWLAAHIGDVECDSASCRSEPDETQAYHIKALAGVGLDCGLNNVSQIAEVAWRENTLCWWLTHVLNTRPAVSEGFLSQQAKAGGGTWSWAKTSAASMSYELITSDTTHGGVRLGLVRVVQLKLTRNSSTLKLPRSSFSDSDGALSSF